MNTFLDEATIYVQGGAGGNGSMHFHREKYVPLGGPDGGDGGVGGGVVLRADRGVNTLYAFKRKRRFVAESGQAGGAARMHGRSARDLVINVPVGTIVRNPETGEVLADLTQHDQTVVVARGGKGGLGNSHFKTSTHQAPRFAETGEPGQERWLDLELKVIAEVGLVGRPNAGKSTLLSVISAARPKIADYPFTTLTPNLGVVAADDFTFVVADIPGLIEGAHEGVGLGHEFLRHIERTLLLVHVVDGSADDPMESFHQIERELRAHDAALADKQQLVVVNKLDVPEAQEQWPELERGFKERGLEVLAISAITREGVDRLVYRMADIVRERAAVELEAREEQVEVITIQPRPDRFEVERKRKTFYVRGEDVERLAVMTDIGTDEGFYRLQRRLKRMGVLSALQKAGIQDGARVRIGETEFTWNSSEINT